MRLLRQTFYYSKQNDFQLSSHPIITVQKYKIFIVITINMFKKFHLYQKFNILT